MVYYPFRVDVKVTPLWLYAASNELKRLGFFFFLPQGDRKWKATSLNKILYLGLHSTSQMYKVKSDNFTVKSLIRAQVTPVAPIPTPLAWFKKLTENLRQKADPKVSPNTSSTLNGQAKTEQTLPWLH